MMSVGCGREVRGLEIQQSGDVGWAPSFNCGFWLTVISVIFIHSMST